MTTTHPGKTPPGKTPPSKTPRGKTLVKPNQKKVSQKDAVNTTPMALPSKISPRGLHDLKVQKEITSSMGKMLQQVIRIPKPLANNIKAIGSLCAVD